MNSTTIEPPSNIVKTKIGFCCRCRLFIFPIERDSVITASKIVNDYSPTDKAVAARKAIETSRKQWLILHSTTITSEIKREVVHACQYCCEAMCVIKYTNSHYRALQLSWATQPRHFCSGTDRCMRRSGDRLGSSAFANPASLLPKQTHA